MGVSVTRRINEVKQPKGGYLNPKDLEQIQLPTKNDLQGENIPPSLVGLAVDYLTRFSLTKNVYDAFAISLIGAKLGGFEKKANLLLKNIKLPLDTDSVISATRLCGYDAIYRAGPMAYRPVEEILPDDKTINNILEMVRRSLDFFEKYGPITSDGFTFEKKGYTNTVSTGDGDFLTKDTLWDFKVSGKEPTNKHTLQLLMYWIMGKHSLQTKFEKITKIGIYNPRLNRVFTYDLSNLKREVVEEIENDVICYEK